MADTIRVLHVLGSMNIGGQETFIMNIYRSIDRSKVQFDFLLNYPSKCDYEDEIISMGGIVCRIPRRFPNYMKHLKYLDNFLKNNNYDIVHQHTNSNLAVSTIIKAKKYKISKIIYHSHSSKPDKGIINTIFDILYKSRIKKYATHYFACSVSAADNLFGKYIEKPNIKVIKNAIDTEKFIYNLNSREQKRKELKIENKFVIGHIGRFTEAKNHSFIINVFKEIYKKNHSAALLLVGDGELRGDVEKKVYELGLKDNVIFTGLRSDIPELLCAMDVFLFPSLWEGLPVTLVEAQANGLYCVVSDVITKEVKITDMIEYISFNKPILYWADKVLVNINGYERKNMGENIKKSGFDVQNTTLWLLKFYCME